MKQFLILAGLFVLFTSFTEPLSLQQTKWQLTAMHFGERTDYIYTGAFIRLDPERKHAGGNASCNVFGGSFTLDGNNLKFGAIISTQMYCEAVQQIEKDFLHLLGKINRYEIKDNRLLLYRDSELLMEFTGSPES